MKLSEFKTQLKDRLNLIKASIVFTAQSELAYAGNNWANLLATVAYTTSILIFINVVYSNVQTVAGYTYTDMLMYFFVYQITYYTNQLTTYRNLENLVPEVNNGNLDLILVKPVPILFFLMTRTISLVSLITIAIPPMLAICFSINWNSLSISLPNLVIGILVWVCGLISLHVIQIIAALPVFWFGESENILNLATAATSASSMMIPFEGYNQTLQKILGTVFPMLIATGFTVSVLLGKSNSMALLIWAFVVAIIAILLRNMAWKFALKHYTSASS